MTELEAAQAIAQGALPSPYRLGGMTLFAVRVTGTGMAYRDSLDEYVWRDPSLYLNDEFLARVAGLPLVWVHPEKGSLNSQEFADRVIGTLMFGYIQGEDVWAVARVYDDEAIRKMTEGQLSTSPGVVFKPGDGNISKEHEGKKFLIEGKPSILDHLAVCEQGVWDKGGDPVGVLSETHTQERGTTRKRSGMRYWTRFSVWISVWTRWRRKSAGTPCAATSSARAGATSPTRTGVSVTTRTSAPWLTRCVRTVSPRTTA
jgi:hypothetical protein